MIELRNLTKSYATSAGRHFVFKDLNFAFPDVNIGLIGPNGAGKSTLMRLISGIESPDSGRIVSDRRISWPIGLAGGLQSRLSGRDNVSFVCRINGATGELLRERIAFVREFADIGLHFDMPVNTYSSGMRSRLTFALSMAFDFDVYLVDEVMAVGDADFKAKAMDAFDDRLKDKNVIVCSHNMAEIRRLCDVIVLIRDGQARVFEDIEEGINTYFNKVRPADHRRRSSRAAAATEVCA